MGSHPSSPPLFYSSNHNNVAIFRTFQLTLLPSLFPNIHLAYLKNLLYSKWENPSHPTRDTPSRNSNTHTHTHTARRTEYPKREQLTKTCLGAREDNFKECPTNNKYISQLITLKFLHQSLFLWPQELSQSLKDHSSPKLRDSAPKVEVFLCGIPKFHRF